MRAPRPGAARWQRGAAMLVLLVLLGVALPMVLAATHRLPRPEEQVRQRSVRALLAAREALIARAIKGRRDTFSTSDEPDFRPGSLPCPDIDDNGSADGSNCFGYLGRLPYKTLEIDDLRDGGGERLWYALSPAFRPAVYPLIASRGQLRLRPEGDDIVALLFAPGQVLGNQTRGCDRRADTSSIDARSRCAALDPANFLEGRNAQSFDAAAVAKSPAIFESRSESGRADGGFNDLVVVLTSNMFMPQVEGRVVREAARCLGGMGTLLSAVDAAGRAFPEAALWLPGSSLCGAAKPNGYFDAWRPNIRLRRTVRDQIVVTAGRASACLTDRGKTC